MNTSKFLHVQNKMTNTNTVLICFPWAGSTNIAFSDWTWIPKDIAVIKVRYPGSGSNCFDPSIYNFQKLTSEIASEITNYCEQKIIFFGHSMGALVCYDVAQLLNSKAIKRLVLSGFSPPQFFSMDRIKFSTNNEVIDFLNRLSGLPPVLLNDEQSLTYFVNTTKVDLRILSTYCKKEYKPLGLPITAINGLNDWMCSTEQMKGWEQHTKCRFEHFEFEGGHHFYLSQYEFKNKILQIISDINKLI